MAVAKHLATSHPFVRAGNSQTFFWRVARDGATRTVQNLLVYKSARQELHSVLHLSPYSQYEYAGLQDCTLLERSGTRPPWHSGSGSSRPSMGRHQPLGRFDEWALRETSTGNHGLHRLSLQFIQRWSSEVIPQHATTHAKLRKLLIKAVELMGICFDQSKDCWAIYNHNCSADVEDQEGLSTSLTTKKSVDPVLQSAAAAG